MKESVGVLVFLPERARGKNSFDDNINIGANVIVNELKKARIDVSFCSAHTANRHKIVLVSLTSTYDIYNFYTEVGKNAKWQKCNRDFVVIAGGFGMQNPTVIRDYIDYAVFGRADGFIVDMVKTILGGGHFENDHTMKMPDIYRVKMAMSGLYKSDFFDEKFIGCKNKCKFCHYTWSRKRIGDDIGYHQELFGRSPELLFKDINKDISGRVLTAIDGFSEKLRFVFGKKISTASIINKINDIGSDREKMVVMRVYNIGNMPYETADDVRELYDALGKIDKKCKCILVLQTTPFRPSLITPMRWYGASLSPNWNKRAAKYIVDNGKGKFNAIHSFTNESSFSHLKTLVVERATVETDRIFDTICFSKKLKKFNADKKVRLIKNNFDISKYTKKYSPDDKYAPGWFLSSYVDDAKIVSAFKWAERQF